MGLEQFPGTCEFPREVKLSDVLELWNENVRRVLEAHYNSAALGIVPVLPVVVIATILGVTAATPAAVR